MNRHGPEWNKRYKLAHPLGKSKMIEQNIAKVALSHYLAPFEYSKWAYLTIINFGHLFISFYSLRFEYKFQISGPSKQSDEHFNSESDLSCCEDANEDLCERMGSTSNLSSSHSMSRYGSESPLRSLLIPEYTTVILFVSSKCFSTFELLFKIL